MTQMQIPQHVEEIIHKLNEHGFEAFAVGGCVRDTLLQREPGDWDITTSARPQQVKALFRRTIDTGIQHGTVTIMFGKTGYEVTTYRIDGEYEDGRHPKQVEFTSNLTEDLKRRDFTINAMAYSHQTGIVDEFGGMEDLERHTIRCVGVAMERFTEDALRILRAIRFSAQLDFTIEEETRKAISVIAPNIAKVSKERIQVELTKLLLSDHPEYMKQVFGTGISPYISPAFAKLPWQNICIPNTLKKEKYIRWAACLRLVDADQAVRILKDLKLDNDTIGKVKTLVNWSGRELAAEAEPVRRGMSQMDPEVWDALLELNEYSDEIRRLTAQIRADGDCLSLKELDVKGRDLMEAGVKPGKELGNILGQMLDYVLAHPGENQKERLLEMFVRDH